MAALAPPLLVPLLVAALGLAGCTGERDREGAGTRIRVSSPSLGERGAIPERFTCEGEERSPALRWSGIPRGTVELALTVEDPDAPRGTFVHWVVWGIDPARGGLDEGELPAGARQGANSTAGPPGYLGPCPPPGSPHRYVFSLYALDRRLDLPEGASIGELRRAMAGNVLAEGRLVATYGR